MYNEGVDPDYYFFLRGPVLYRVPTTPLITPWTRPTWVAVALVASSWDELLARADAATRGSEPRQTGRIVGRLELLWEDFRGAPGTRRLDLGGGGGGGGGGGDDGGLLRRSGLTAGPPRRVRRRLRRCRPSSEGR